MKSPVLKLTAYLVLVLFIMTPLLAEAEADDDGPIVGSATITLQTGKVWTFADASASNDATEGWYWIHARVLPYNDKYSDVSSESISGYVYDSVSTHRTGKKKNGRAYCSMWARSSEGYHSVLVDLPE